MNDELAEAEDFAEQPDLNEGCQVGDFTLVEFLGKGGMGQVWKANDGTRDVALKFLLPDFWSDAEEVGEVRRTFNINSSLRHKHICNVLELIDDPAYGPVLVMDFVPGKKLSKFRFDEPLDGKLPPELAFQILRPIANALDCIHEANVLHGDVRPENILVVESAGLIRDVRLIDFGLAVRFGDNADASEQISHENPRYKAPEQLQDDNPALDGRTDQFALVTIAYELLAGYPPFGSNDDQNLRHEIMYETPEAAPDEVPLAVEEVLVRGLEKNREDRFPTCSEFLAAMERAWPPA